MIRSTLCKFSASSKLMSAVFIASLSTLLSPPMFAQTASFPGLGQKPGAMSGAGTFAKAYNVPNGYSAAESISQASSGGFVVGAVCNAGSTTPTCNGPATVLRVDSSGNIQSQTQYSYENASLSTGMNIIRATSDGGAIFAGQPQSGCPTENMTRCAAIVKVDSTGKVQWANDLQFADSSAVTSPFDIQQTT